MSFSPALLCLYFSSNILLGVAEAQRVLFYMAIRFLAVEFTLSERFQRTLPFLLPTPTYTHFRLPFSVFLVVRRRVARPPHLQCRPHIA